jgi:hypothetical protein
MVRWLGILLRTFRATRRVESVSATAAADGDAPDLLDRVVEPLEELAEFLAGRPETVVRWHRRGFRPYWAWKIRRRWGRPAIERDLRDLIRQMSRANPLWGAPRIHGEPLNLGLTVSQATVSKYMVRPRRPPSQAWRTFLKNHAPDLIALDFFTVPTATFRVLFVLVVLTHRPRRLVHFNVTEHPTAEWSRRGDQARVEAALTDNQLRRASASALRTAHARALGSMGFARWPWKPQARARRRSSALA